MKNNRDSCAKSDFIKSLFLFSVILSIISGFVINPLFAQTTIWNNVTVVNISGWEYINVTVEFISQESIILITNSDGGQKKISRSGIRLILDNRGKDITSQVLEDVDSGDSKPQGSSLHEGPEPTNDFGEGKNKAMSFSEYREIQRHKANGMFGPRYRIALSGGVGFSTTVGQWFEGITSGPGFDFCARIAIMDNMYIGGNFKHQILGVDDELEGSYIVYDDFGNPYTITVEFDVSLDEIFFMIGYMPDQGSYAKPFAFVEFGLGAIIHNIKVTATDGSIVESASTDDTKFGMLWRIGGVFPLNKYLGLSIAASMRLTGQGDSSQFDGYDDGSTGILFGAGFAFTYMARK